MAITLNDITNLSLFIGRLVQHINPTHRSVAMFIIGEGITRMLCICGSCVVLCSAGAGYSCYMKCRKFRREWQFWQRKTFFTKKNGFQQQVPFQTHRRKIRRIWCSIGDIFRNIFGPACGVTSVPDIQPDWQQNCAFTFLNHNCRMRTVRRRS